MNLLFLIIITVLSAVPIIYVIRLYIINKLSAQALETTLKKRSNFFSYVSMVAGVLALLLGVLSYYQSIKKPEFKIEIVNEQGNYSETMGGNLFVEKYSNEGIYYSYPVPTTWTLKIINIGERTAKNVSIKLEFDNISFEREYIYDYKTTDHQRGIGGWQGLLYNKSQDILPGESIVLPYLPFGKQAHLNNFYDIENGHQNPNSFKMKILIYADDMVKYEKKYKVEIRTPEFGELSIENDENARFENILDKISPSEQYYTTYEFSYNDYKAIEIPQSISTNDLEFAYFYCLSKINSENSYNMRRFTLIFGRYYYEKIFKDLNAIEAKIANDIWSEIGNTK